jgi:CrcB protein
VITGAVAVVCGAAVGAPARYLVDLGLSRRLGRGLPWGTLAVNLSGSAVIGVLAGLLAADHVDAGTYALAATGFCGAFTTFSTFIWESIALVEEGWGWRALANLAVTAVAGIGLCALGFALASA